jgi:hypothetical protein
MSTKADQSGVAGGGLTVVVLALTSVLALTFVPPVPALISVLARALVVDGFRVEPVEAVVPTVVLRAPRPIFVAVFSIRL